MQIEAGQFSETLSSHTVASSTSRPAAGQRVLPTPANYVSDPESAGTGRRARRFGLPTAGRRPLRLRVGRRQVSVDDSELEHGGGAEQEGRAAGGWIKRHTAGRKLGAMLKISTPYLSLRSYSHNLPFKVHGTKHAYQKGNNSTPPEPPSAIRRAGSLDRALSAGVYIAGGGAGTDASTERSQKGSPGADPGVRSEVGEVSARYRGGDATDSSSPARIREEAFFVGTRDERLPLSEPEADDVVLERLKRLASTPAHHLRHSEASSSKLSGSQKRQPQGRGGGGGVPVGSRHGDRGVLTLGMGHAVETEEGSAKRRERRGVAGDADERAGAGERFRIRAERTRRSASGAENRPDGYLSAPSGDSGRCIPIARRKRMTGRSMVSSSASRVTRRGDPVLTGSTHDPGTTVSSEGAVYSGTELSPLSSETSPVAGRTGGAEVDWSHVNLALPPRVSKRRRLAELLHFRRKAGGGADSSAKSPSGSSRYRTSQRAEADGRALSLVSFPSRHRRSGSAPPTASPLDDANDDDDDDGDDEDDDEEEDGDGDEDGAGVTSSGGRGRDWFSPGKGIAAAGSIRGVGAGPQQQRRRRSPKGSSSSSPPKRSSLLEASKYKLRRGKHRLSRGVASVRKAGAGREHTREEVAQQQQQQQQQRQRESPVDQGPPPKPQLGTTFAGRSSTAPLDDHAAAPWNTWSNGMGSEFRVRTKGYARTKAKAPSAPALYELVSVDAYRSPAGRLCEVYPMFSPPLALSEPGMGRLKPPGGLATSKSVDGTSARPRANLSGGLGEVTCRTRRSMSDGMYEAGQEGGRDTAASGDRYQLSPDSRRSAYERLRGLKPGGSGGDSTSGSGKLREKGSAVKGVAANGNGSNGNACQGDGDATANRGSKRGDAESARRTGDTGGFEEPKGTGHPDIPPVFVVNGQLPDVAPPLAAHGDGPTIHVILTFRATPRLCRFAARLWAADPRSKLAGKGVAGQSNGVGRRKEDCGPQGACTMACQEGVDRGKAAPEGGLDGEEGQGQKEEEGGTMPESVPLLAEWMRRAPEDGDFRGRFKAIGDVINVDEVGLPGFARRFNAKPVLIYGKECTMMRGDGFAELDLNAHNFSFLGRKGLHVTLEKWKSAILRIGFLIEARSDEEQPEHMLGCAVLKGLDLGLTQELSLSPDGERLIVGNPTDAGGEVPAAGDGRGVRSATSASGKSDQGAEASHKGTHSLVPLLPRRHLESLRKRGRPMAGKGLEPCSEEPGAQLIQWVKMIGGAIWFPVILALATIVCWVDVCARSAIAEGQSGESVGDVGAQD